MPVEKKYSYTETAKTVDASQTFEARICMNAIRIEPQTDGTFYVFIAARPWSDDERRMIKRMFPHTFDEVSVLLQQELLLGAIVRD